MASCKDKVSAAVQFAVSQLINRTIVKLSASV